MQTIVRNSLALVVLCGLSVGCGDDPPQNTGNTQSDDNGDAGSRDNNDSDNDSTQDNDSTETTNDTTQSDTDDDSSNATTDVDLPDPVLDDLPSETPLSDLDEDELAEVCAAYLKTATSITENLDGICPAQAVITASQGGSTTEDELQQECVTAEATCVTQVQASKAALGAANCEEADECGATIEDFNACNRQVAALDQMVIVPVGNLDAPACESVTATEAGAFAISGGFQLLIWMQQASEAGGGAPTDEGGPCQRIQEQCPELGAVLNAFEGLQIPEL